MSSIGNSKSYYVKLSSEANHEPQNVMRLTHNYSGHPLFTLSSLEQLAERLQLANRGQIKFLAKGIQLDSNFNTQTENADKLSISDVFAILNGRVHGLPYMQCKQILSTRNCFGT